MIEALALDGEREAVREAVAAFCRDAGGTPRFDRTAWQALGALGVLAIATPEGEGGPRELAAAGEALGAAAFVGPFVETAIAVQLLSGAARERVGAGRAIAAVGWPPLLAWAPEAELFVALAPERSYLGRPLERPQPLDTLAGEPWARVALERTAELGETAHALRFGRLAAAALLAGGARRLLEDAAAHARARRQFGRAIGDFQAVAHPLADLAIRVGAAEMGVRVAAWRLEVAGAAADARVAAAWLAARAAALRAAHVAHQVFGAVGITLEGPAFRLSRRLRHVASWPLAPERARESLLAELGLAAEAP